MTGPGHRMRTGLWLPGLLVAAGAAVATAHGLYEVARAAGAPTAIAALYPLICDGLALVAYGATSRLHESSGRAYAWTIVVLAAGLSGLAQAAYLAGDGVHAVPAWLRFGVGAWPAAAAAIAAHLLHLLGRTAEHNQPYDPYGPSYSRTPGPYGVPDRTAGPYDEADRTAGPYGVPYGRTAGPYEGSYGRTPGPAEARDGAVDLQGHSYGRTTWPDEASRTPEPGPYELRGRTTDLYESPYGRTTGSYEAPYDRTPRPYETPDRTAGPYDEAARTAGQDGAPYGRTTGPYEPVRPDDPAEQDLDGLPAAGERARAAARGHRDRTGALPTVTELVALAEVGRGTAGAALKALRTEHLNGTPRRER